MTREASLPDPTAGAAPGETERLRTLELFAGIGGLGLAAPGALEVVAAWDQDASAAETHARNHGVPVVRRDLSSALGADLLRHEADAWLLSPPCQPFTRRGTRRDVSDPRCRGLLRLIDLLPQCRPRRVLVENVVGFHGSRAHALLIAALRSLGHDVRDVEACPSEQGAPVRRPRHFVVSSADGLRPVPAASEAAVPGALATYLDPEPDAGLAVPDDVRRRVDDHLPAAGPDGPLPTFTGSYGRAITGAGPVLRDGDRPRYFSPEEILRLHGFPDGFSFPPELSLRRRWKLAGNAVHVACVRRVASAIG